MSAGEQVCAQSAGKLITQLAKLHEHVFNS